MIPEQCENDGQCPYPEYCVIECDPGLGPLCASAECIEGKCQTIVPCSRKTRCTVDDVSQCIVPQICARCLEGYGPGCAEATCKDGECRIVYPCSIPPTTTSAPQCRTDGECSFVKQCVDECKDGLGPPCAFGKCINGKCVITLPCSQKIRCTVDDVSQCIVPPICADCLEGYGPGCAEATCKDGECRIISPCSIPPTTTSAPQCRTDGECSFVKQCVDECKDGLGPLCAFGKCINGKCVITLPCSQKTRCTDDDVSQCIFRRKCADCFIGRSPACTTATCKDGECQIIEPCSQGPQCTENDVSQCAVPKICGLCNEGYSPPCARAICENGECKTIMPCTIYTGTTTTTPTTGTCTCSSQCSQINNCVRICPADTLPLCTIAKCLNRKCTYIKPCSQRLCTTRATCLYNKQKCGKCAPGYGPPCEQPACIGGICSIISPCSQKLSIAIDIASVE